ncbi:MAG TPA: pilus assembly protein [Marmoricola sp.]|nr:pilus assembly protein [Marmoricola sp.]
MTQRTRRDDEGAAVVDFVLVSLVLIPLVLGVMQVALVLHVRNTLTAAATEGARYGAALNRTPAQAVAHTRAQISGAIAARYAAAVTAGVGRVGGVPQVEVRVVARVPALGLWGPAVELNVTGHATQEQLP